jgi:hypothetical protein
MFPLMIRLMAIPKQTLIIIHKLEVTLFVMLLAVLFLFITTTLISLIHISMVSVNIVPL